MAIVKKSSRWPSHKHLVSDLHFIHVLRHKTTLWEPRVNICVVHFDEEINVSFLRHHTYWSVFSLNLISFREVLRLNHSTKKHVHSDWETKNHILVLKLESENIGVIGHLDLFS